ncbi:MAG: aminotransferase class V-fold PLP-dependent enzyme, partial [Gemmatimonadota bacterium]|nr:aminotransferase class V-fold PLP-dependent enzyme [Gemmatimonadota bacterium]
MGTTGQRGLVDRRAFLAASGGALWAGGACGPPETRQTAGPPPTVFPRGERETFLNAAGGMPLTSFSESGLTRYMDFIRLGPDEGRGDYFNQMWSEIRGDFAALIGAQADEVALVHSTKAGEQLVMDGLPALHAGGNLVTNDFHFSGSLHNLSGMRDRGFDVRIVKSDGKDLPLESMTEVIDDRTALVSITLLSNVNGRLEPVRALADAVHDAGGYLYADIIQAAGVHPIDVEAMGIDFAACSAYKWLYGVHGTGFFYVRGGLETEALTRHTRFPGNARHNYPPWTAAPAEGVGDFVTAPPLGARRFEPGHVS